LLFSKKNKLPHYNSNWYLPDTVFTEEDYKPLSLFFDPGCKDQHKIQREQDQDH